MPKIKYSESIKARAVRAARADATDDEIAAILGCAGSTIRKWKRERPGFAEALEQARLPDGSDDAIALLEKRQKRCTELIDDFLESGLIETTVIRGPDGEETTKEKFSHLPPQWLLERVLGPAEGAGGDFNITISVAEPELDEDYYDDFEEEEI